MKTVIHVNQHNIRRNQKTGSRDPVLSAKTYKSNDYGHRVLIKGPAIVLYEPDNPLSCGARCWIETDSEVEVL